MPLSSHNGPPRPSVDAAHAVDGYLFDQQLINFGDVFIIGVSVIADHLIKAFPLADTGTFTSNLEVQARAR